MPVASCGHDHDDVTNACARVQGRHVEYAHHASRAEVEALSVELPGVVFRQGSGTGKHFPAVLGIEGCGCSPAHAEHAEPGS